jgi:VanZ family protein
MITWVRLGPRTAGVLCVLSLCCILIAGLWPFGHPPNDVTWVANHSAVRFGRHGTILSFSPLLSDDVGSCSIEMWLRPRLSDGSGTLLGFYDRDLVAGLSLRQSVTDLRLDREVGRGRPAKMYVSDVFSARKLVFLTIVSGPSGTTVYLNGSRVRQVSDFKSSSPCSGRFVVGDSPKEQDTWEGELDGLAIYRGELPPEQVLLNYQSWSNAGRPAENGSGALAALYLFDERGGNLIRDHLQSGVNLSIPERYMVVQETVYESPWNAFQPTWGWVEDVLVNVTGFIPFGFTLSALLWCSGWKRAGVFAVLGGLLVSLTIEGLQAFLPTRDSDLTDVLTNTLGTSLGVILHRRWIRWSI